MNSLGYKDDYIFYPIFENFLVLNFFFEFNILNQF